VSKTPPLGLDGSLGLEENKLAKNPGLSASFGSDGGCCPGIGTGSGIGGLPGTEGGGRFVGTLGASKGDGSGSAVGASVGMAASSPPDFLRNLRVRVFMMGCLVMFIYYIKCKI
jgi:hypothetical protein